MMAGPDTDKPAVLIYAAAQFQILSPGSHVVCARTGLKIALEDLRYWNVERQEPYISPEASLKAVQGSITGQET